ncbi:hypothetical protein [bacterium endosymbiont of Bathymodiolus sp. 5 South]|nr:hypothetical protein [bacterium endosymbiont of Bathymodiolus sp. 5 South]CAC9640786.1 hypothetical protein [uncultured Gammaproteobacteria bacterium]CAC9643255.1 hypothetical protein [uncultured Gammaproteobacteria bacterium]CAC9651769.1 hypothetical protein [uncultured Gammaproteobacteria bacterium]SHN90596.1 hypothetical protein BCLUESOX_728 [bacterium endosymbiont of Bathymodiolus sp. 5 South]VVH55257.1 hypothetical protein BSPCLSOX_2013 [uncultured Gammaproteobacteria bacterium]
MGKNWIFLIIPIYAKVSMTIFHKITKSAKLVILLITPIYAKVSH